MQAPATGKCLSEPKVKGTFHVYVQPDSREQIGLYDSCAQRPICHVQACETVEVRLVEICAQIKLKACYFPLTSRLIWLP